MDNLMELEKRPSQAKPDSGKLQSQQTRASVLPPALQLKASGPVYQLQGDPEEEELQMKKADSGGASSLPASIQQSAESHFQSDFSNVKVHTDSTKAADLGALAYTQGSDIHFAPKAYNPHTASGKSLIGHELTHVVQQSEGRVNPTGEIQGLPLNDDASLEREADVLGAKFAQ